MMYSRGWKYRTEESLVYRLKCRYRSIRAHRNTWWALEEYNGAWFLVIFNRYAWNGANRFPDFGWIMTQCLIHDVLHEAIESGVIGEDENDTIDRELDLAIQGGAVKRASQKALLKIRGWYVRLATNTANSKKGDGPKIHEIPKIDGEMTLEEFGWLTGNYPKTP